MMKRLFQVADGFWGGGGLESPTDFALCTGLKKDGRRKAVPLLGLMAVASRAGMSDDQGSRLSRADRFVSKPFKAAPLLTKIRRLLGERTSDSR